MSGRIIVYSKKIGMALDTTVKKELPFSTEAEKAVLGGIMLRNETWDLVSDLVKEDDFHKEEHLLIYLLFYLSLILLLAERLFQYQLLF